MSARPAARIPIGQKARFKKLSRIWLRCFEPDAAARIESALDCIKAEFVLAQKSSDMRMRIRIGDGYLWTGR
jgi:hypothetical protein